MKYTLTVDDAQVRTILHALDLYSRIGCGQFDEIRRLFQFDSRKREGADKVDIGWTLDAIKQSLLPLERGVGYSINNRDVPQTYRMAYDILQVLRHCKAWHDRPEGGPFVQFDSPFQTGDHEFCTVEAVVDTRKELEGLRVSMARVAQVVGVETTECPVLDKGYSDLCKMAAQDRGWNNLAGAICEKAGENLDR